MAARWTIWTRAPVSHGNPDRSLIAELRFMNVMLRRAQIRIGTRPLSEWLRGENQFEAKRGTPPNFAVRKIRS
jgi:hypothetical protein